MILHLIGPGYALGSPLDDSSRPAGFAPSAAAQDIVYQLHRQAVNHMNVSWANTGVLSGIVPFESRSDCDNELSQAVEYPKGSRNKWDAFDLWVGGIRAGDTLVSTTGSLEWNTLDYEFEWWPAPPPEGLFVEKTLRDQLDLGVSCGLLSVDESSVSEHDMVSVATDTVTNPLYSGNNPFEQGRRKPLGLRLTCRRYAWSQEYAADFVIAQYVLKNIGLPGPGGATLAAPIRDVMIGLNVSGQTYHWFQSATPPSRDPTGFTGRIDQLPLKERPELAAPCNLVWAANESGNPLNGAFDQFSNTSVYALQLIQPTEATTRFAYNWWTGYQQRDAWGPVRLASRVEFVLPGNLGRPETDAGKYQLMTNGEVDYPQVESAFHHQGWLAPPPNAIESANGTRPSLALLSFGPYQLAPDDSLVFAIALVGAEDFHTDPFHYATTFDPVRPERYIEGLNFEPLYQHALWASWMYDSPGRDSDGDGYKGRFLVDGSDTLYYEGDGIPDFSGPPPPPAPHLSATFDQGQIRLHWNGHRAETSLDPFFNRRDFEGYRVYMSRTGRPGEWSMVAQRDLFNHARYTWSEAQQRWLMHDPPFSRDSLNRLYDTLCLVQYGHAFEPDSFAVANKDEALLEIQFDPRIPDRLDTFYRYFGPFGANASPDDAELRAAEQLGPGVFNVVRKLYPDSSDSATALRPDGSTYYPFYEYEIAIRDLQVAEPVMLAVTSFDHGDPASGFGPLETTPETNAQTVWPLASAEIVKSERPEPGVYPNPYRLIDDYYGNNWENRRGLEPDRERARQVTFYNVPDTCTLSIWSLDGDLVRKIKHYADPGSSEATVVKWDLITRNTQAVKTGIYIWSIESRFGTDVGKLVIIK